MKASNDIFFKDILQSYEKTEILIGEFRSWLRFRLGSRIEKITGRKFNMDGLLLTYDDFNQRAVIYLILDESDSLQKLNLDKDSIKYVTEALKKITNITVNLFSMMTFLSRASS
jgi:hypothetical protein